MSYYGFGAVVRGKASAPPSNSTSSTSTSSVVVSGKASAPPIGVSIADTSKIFTSVIPTLKPQVPMYQAVFVPSSDAASQQVTMYQCPNGKLVSSPDISLCEENIVSSTDSDFNKYLLPIGIVLAAILLLK